MTTWTAEEIEVLKELYPNRNIPWSEILYRFPGRTRQAIELRARKAGLIRRPKIDLTGQRFGRLIVVGYSHSEAYKDSKCHYRYWNCLCDCGNRCVIFQGNLRRKGGHTESCGCLKTDLARERATIHGQYGTRAHSAWANMIARCENPKSSSYSIYGGRGIKVCDRWKSFEAFYADMGQPDNETLSIERIDVDGNYEPDNCIWGSRMMQALNQRPTKDEYFDLIETLDALCSASGVDFIEIKEAFRRGESMHEVVMKSLATYGE